MVAQVRWRRVRSAPGTWRLEARVSWLSLKTKVVEGFPVWASKPSVLRFVGCATKLTEGGRCGTHIEI
jgi:hypothetical protein